MRLPRLVTVVVLTVASSISPVPANARSAGLRVMTFNVRLYRPEDGANDWEHRRAIAIAAIRRTRPDVIGTQELFQRQGDDLVAGLPGYTWFGIDRRGGHGDEHMGVIYNRRALRVVTSGQFWLSDTPEMPGSISWGHPYPRMVTWAVFERRGDKRRFRLLNTHLPYRAEDEDARTSGARLILDKMGVGGGAMPTVVTGDFNTTPASPAYRVLTTALVDAWHAAPRRTGPEATFHDFTGRPDRRIDWILVRGLRIRAAETLTDHRGPTYASDHFPVLADLSF